MPPASRITRLLTRHGDELARLQDDQARALLRLAEDARRELRERLEALGGYTAPGYSAQATRVLLVQVETTVAALRRRMGEAIEGQSPALARMALNHLLVVIRAHEGDLADAGNRIEVQAIGKMLSTPDLLLHRNSLDAYGAALIGKIQGEIVRGLQTGATIPQLARRIGRTDGVFAALHGRAELIARMEVSRAYNAMHHEALVEAAAVLDDPDTSDPLLRRADEYLDSRNDPVSRVIDGLVTGIGSPWMVRVADVRREEDALKRRSGIVWPASGAYYAVQSYPVHFSDRGRAVPYRASWDDGQGLAWGTLTPTQREALPAALRRRHAA